MNFIDNLNEFVARTPEFSAFLEKIEYITSGWLFINEYTASLYLFSIVFFIAVSVIHNVLATHENKEVDTVSLLVTTMFLICTNMTMLLSNNLYNGIIVAEMGYMFVRLTLLFKFKK